MRRRAMIAATITAILAAGCGGTAPWLRLPRLPGIGPDVFVLDWTGGPNALWPAGDLAATDLSAFEVSTGGTLADIEGFRGMVRDQVEVILRAAGIDAAVVTGERRPDANVVHISPVAVDEEGDRVLGRGHYDPCNRGHRDSCIVYAEAIIVDELSCAVGEWVNVFANITAHEIGHNLGFTHVEVADLPPWTGYVELMLAKQTWYNRKLEQRILVEQDTCPDVTAAKCAPISMPAATGP